MKPTIEQIEQYRRIVADAPKGATHYCSTCDYLKYDNKTGYWSWWWGGSEKKWVESSGDPISEYDSMQLLDDLREIIALHDENDKLREALEKIKGMSSMSYHSLESAKIVASNALKELLK